MVEFHILEFQRYLGSPDGYHHRRTRVDVNCGCEDTKCHVHRPLATQDYDGKVKTIAGTKKGYTSSAAVGFSRGPTAQVAGSAMHEKAETKETVHSTSRIQQYNGDGAVWWIYDVDDGNDRNSGLRVSGDKLPKAEFTVLPNATSIMPPSMQVSVGQLGLWTLRVRQEIRSHSFPGSSILRISILSHVIGISTIIFRCAFPQISQLTQPIKRLLMSGSTHERKYDSPVTYPSNQRPGLLITARKTVRQVSWFLGGRVQSDLLTEF